MHRVFLNLVVGVSLSVLLGCRPGESSTVAGPDSQEEAVPQSVQQSELPTDTALSPGGEGGLSGATAGWAQWRGPNGDGVAPAGRPPTEWSETKNVVWKTKVPGRGHSTPIIWGKQLFLLTAIPVEAASGASLPPVASETIMGQRSPGRGGGRGGFGTPQEAGEHDFVTLSYDLDTGEERWRKTARREAPHEGMSGMGASEHGYASASPVTDGQRLYSYFGSRGLYAYSLAGELQWKRDFGDMRTRNAFGEGISPALAGDVLVVVWDEEGESFIYALDKNSGEILWQKPRNERSSWSTPCIVEHDGQDQVIVNGTEAVRSYDLHSGDSLWECAGQTANAIPVPVHHDGVVIAMSGFRGNALYAIRLGSRGVLTGTDAVVWTHDRGTPYVPSPLLFDGKVWFCQKNDGILSCFDATTGQEYFSQERLGIRGVYASPVAAGGQIYIAGRDGNTVVIENSAPLKILATNELDEKFDASPAVVGDRLYLRGQEYLYCIGEG